MRNSRGVLLVVRVCCIIELIFVYFVLVSSVSLWAVEVSWQDVPHVTNTIQPSLDNTYRCIPHIPPPAAHHDG